MPWDLIRTLITETYGGKIDDEGDFNQLRQIVDGFLTPEAYDDDHVLIKGGYHHHPDSSTEVDDHETGDLVVPTGTSMQGFREWVNDLPEREPPTYLGLPAYAEKLLLIGQGKMMMRNLARITEVLEEGEMEAVA